MADSSQQLNFPLLRLVSDARSTYGLRHQDFGRYRSHCVAKVHHLRKSVGLSQTQGKSRRYQNKPVEADKVTSDKHLQIVLFDAERCWAHSQLLKSTLDDPSTPPATKHLFVKRLAKAAAHADALLRLVRSDTLAPRISAVQLAQVQAYALVRRGTVAFERNQHADGLNALSVAHEVLGRLAETAPTATDEALANEVIDEVEPMLRFCAYRLGLDTATGVAAIARDVAAKAGEAVLGGEDLSARLAQEGQRGQRESVEIRWRGEKVPVRNPELVGPAGKVQEALARLQQEEDLRSQKRDGVTLLVGNKEPGCGLDERPAAAGKKEIFGVRRMGAYDKALLVLSDAEALAHQLVEDNEVAASKGYTARSEASARPLAQFHAYVQYSLLSVRLKRDLLLIASSAAKLARREAKIRATEDAFVARTGARDAAVAEGKIHRLRARAYPGLVKVFDTALLSLETMRDLEAVERDDQLSTVIEARIALVRAQRCQYLARSYALVPALSPSSSAAASASSSSAPSPLTTSYGSALSLLARAKLYVREARHAAGALEAVGSSFAAQDGHDDDDDDLVGPVLPLEESTFSGLEHALEADERRLAREWFDAAGGRVPGFAGAGLEETDEQEDEQEEDEAEPESLGMQRLRLDGTTQTGRTPQTTPTQTQGSAARKVPFYDVAFNYVTAFDLDAIAARAAGGTGSSSGAQAETSPVTVSSAVSEEEEQEKGDEEKEQPVKRGWGFGLFGRR